MPLGRAECGTAHFYRDGSLELVRIPSREDPARIPRPAPIAAYHPVPYSASDLGIHGRANTG